MPRRRYLCPYKGTGSPGTAVVEPDTWRPLVQDWLDDRLIGSAVSDIRNFAQQKANSGYCILVLGEISDAEHTELLTTFPNVVELAPGRFNKDQVLARIGAAMTDEPFDSANPGRFIAAVASRRRRDFKRARAADRGP